MKKIFALFLALLFVGTQSLPNVSAKTNYGEGSLLKPKGGSAVYYVGPDNKKYVFPEGKTYASWYSDFSQVKEVSVSELDQMPDGGTMPMKGGVKIITHKYTTKVYAVEPGGVLRHIPNEAKARELFGDDWSSKVVDVIPGFFASTYQIGEEVSDTLPNGYLVTDAGKYYYIENGKKRLMTKQALRLNNLKEENALRIKNLNRYGDENSISAKKKSLANFVPPLDDVNEKKVTVCHNNHSISISKNALKAHLRIGDTRGRCEADVNEPDDPEEPEDPIEEVNPGHWCSTLLGLFNSETLGYSSDNPHEILDLNDDGVVNLSDNSMLVSLYNDEDDDACLGHIEDAYTEDDYQDIAWCDALVQGVSDNLGDTSPFSPFDLNNDDKINLSDVSIVASYLYEADQAQCYNEFLPYLDEMSDDDDDEVEPILYTNEIMGFSLTFPVEWEDYLVSANASSTTFGLAGDDDMFVISTMTIAEWDDYQNQVPRYSKYIDENNEYVYVYSQGQDTLDDLVDEALLIESIIDTFEFLNTTD